MPPTRPTRLVLWQAKATEPWGSVLGAGLRRLAGENRVADAASRVITDPRVLGGKPTIRGTRVAVEHVVGWLARGADAADILADYPELHEPDIRACLAFAERLLRNERIDPVPAAGAAE